jgi:hypothetical protein
MVQYNLDNAIYDAKYGKLENTNSVLNDKQRNAFLSLIGKGCRKNTKEKLASHLKVALCMWKRFGIYSRVILTDDDVEYICGQSWNDEMRTLRECILKDQLAI